MESVDFNQYSFDTVAVNVIVAWLIQKMKVSDMRIFAWISQNTPKVNVLVSVVLAAVTAAGMTVDWQQDAHTLTITGISLTNVLIFLWYIIKNVAFQHGAYKAIFKPPVDNNITDGKTVANAVAAELRKRGIM